MKQSTDLLEKLLDIFPGWKSAIADAEQKALEAEQRAVRLRAVADVFKRKKNAGEPWPGSENAPTQNSPLPERRVSPRTPRAVL